MAKTTKSKETANMIEVFADFKEKNNSCRKKQSVAALMNCH
jgi:hypothetical protein